MRQIVLRCAMLVLAAATVMVSPPAQADDSSEVPVQRRFSPFWTSQTGVRTTVHLHNNSVDETLTVETILNLSNGDPVVLGAVTILPYGNVSLEINEALTAKGYTGALYGGAEFRYKRDRPGALSVETSVVELETNLAYSIPSYDRGGWSSNTQHAVFWLPTADSEVYFAMYNVSDEAVVAEPEVQIGGRNVPLESISIPARGFARLELPEDMAAMGAFAAARSPSGLAGGLTLRHRGPAGVLQTTGWISDEHTGYSTMMSFSDAYTNRGQNLYTTQVMLGLQQDLPDVGQTLEVRSHLVVKNMAHQAVRASGVFSYDLDGVVSTTTIPIGNLRPGETHHLDFDRLRKRGLIPASVTEGALKIEHLGSPGSLMGRVFSISRDGTYGFYTAMEDYASGYKVGVHWSLVGDTNSIFTVTNFGDRDDTATIELTFNGGTFMLPGIPLRPAESKRINLRKLVAEGLTDADGNPFPAGVEEGGYEIASSDRLRGSLVVKEHLVSATSKTSMPFYQSCVWGEYLYFSGLGSSFTVNVGGTKNFTPKGQMSNNINVSDSSASAWSNVPSRATVSPSSGSTRTVSGHAEGQFEVDGESAPIPSDASCFVAQVPADPPSSGTVKCAAGINSVNATKTSTSTVDVTFTVVNTDCTSLSTIKVAVAPSDLSGSLTFSWDGGNSRTVPMPSPGNVSSPVTIEGTASGNGTTKFKASVSQPPSTLNPNPASQTSPNSVAF